MSLNIVVCVKQVTNPDYFSEITLDPETGRIEREKVPSVLNPMDENALEEALRLREKFSGKVTAVSMGPPQAKEVLDWALTLGADEAILLSDRAFGGGDTLATAYVLAEAVEKIGQVDIIFCGNEAADGSTQQVGPQIAELLGLPNVTYVNELSFKSEKTVVVKRAIEYGYLKIEVNLPVLISVLREINEPRSATAEGILTLGDKVFKTWTAEDIRLDAESIGLEGSPTRVAGVFEQKLERQREILQGTTEEIVDATIEKLHREALI